MLELQCIEFNALIKYNANGKQQIEGINAIIHFFEYNSKNEMQIQYSQNIELHGIRLIQYNEYSALNTKPKIKLIIMHILPCMKYKAKLQCIKYTVKHTIHRIY